MGEPIKNGFDAISGVSKCFSDAQDYILRMEKDMRELEAAYDDLQDENDKLRNENGQLMEKLRKLTSDPVECRRSFMNDLDRMDAERAKQFMIKTVFDLMTAGIKTEDEDEDDE